MQTTTVTINKIKSKLVEVPQDKLSEVYDFVEFLVNRTGTTSGLRVEEQEWSNFSLSQAMQGLEEEDNPGYTENDLKEKWQ